VDLHLKTRKNLLGIYDSLLSIGAIYTGIIMILGDQVFAEYPNEWLTILPFKSWVIPGIIMMMVFGIGNLIAAIASFKNTHRKSWVTSMIIASILLIIVGAQVAILGEGYMATMQFFLLGLIQLAISVYVFYGYKKV